MSAKRCRKTSDVQLPAKKAKQNVLQSEIKDAKAFYDNFTSHKINKRPKTFVCKSGWNTPQGKAEIAAWIKAVAKYQVRILAGIKRNSEAALYPLIITTLLPIFDLCDCCASANLAAERDRELLDDIANQIAVSQLQKCSRHSYIDAEKPPAHLGGEPVTSAATALPAVTSAAAPTLTVDDFDDLPLNISTTDAAEVSLLMVYIEKWLAAKEYLTKGHVEILIKKDATGETVAVIEARPHISNNDAGFYQCCAYMALKGIPYGIITDHKVFQFVHMDENHVLHHTTLFDLMKSAYDRMDEDATVVYAYLFEIMGVPRDTNLLDKAAQAEILWAQREAELTVRVR